MKIVHYYTRALTGNGGPTLAVRGWARSMASIGHDVTVTCDGGEAPVGDGVRWVPIRHRGKRWLRRPHDLRRWLEPADLLIFHSAWLLYNSRAARDARQAKKPFVITPHGAYDPNIVARSHLRKAAWLALAERRLLRNAAAVHVFFDAERDHLRRLGYRGPVIVSPNGIAIPDVARSDGGSGGYVLWLGRFDIEHKGLDILVDAVARVPVRRRPQVWLHGTDWRGGKKELLRRISARNLGAWVHVGPPVYGDEKWRRIREAALYVHPSRWEACSVSLLEAAAAGLPILATKTNHFGRTLGDRDAALVVEPEPAELAKELAEAAERPPWSIGANARRIISEEFNWRSVAERFFAQLPQTYGANGRA